MPATNSNLRPSEKRALTVQQWCDRYGPSRATFYKLIAEGRLKTVIIGGRRLVSVDEAERLLESGEGA